MAWTAPVTVAPGDAILASLWNEQVRDNLIAIRSVITNVQIGEGTKAGNITVTAGTESTVASVSITPSSASSKILILGVVPAQCVAGASNRLIRTSLKEGATLIRNAEAGSTTTSGIVTTITQFALESPNTTSALTYNLTVTRGSSNTGDILVFDLGTLFPAILAVEIAV